MAATASTSAYDDEIARREAYNATVAGRDMANGHTDAGGTISPWMEDGSINPWIHARNMDPYRGDVEITNFKGEKEVVPFWLADRKSSANLGLIGFEEITDQLDELQRRFSDDLSQQTELGYRNLAEQTDTEYIGMDDDYRRKDRKRDKDKAGNRRRWDA